MDAKSYFSTRSYFFVGLGGSGMLPLALILKAQGAEVAGSDRAYDKGLYAEKFAWIKAQGFALHPQDGTSVRASQTLVASAAVEASVPDMATALALGCTRLTRAELLSALFNAAPHSIGVAGTSGKSTVTAMIGWILHSAGLAPNIVNGAVMKNFITPDNLYASAKIGEADADFVAEIDESDGSIALYNPYIAVLNNISEDHKSMDELRTLFAGYVQRARIAIVNADDTETAQLAEHCDHTNIIRFSLNSPACDYYAHSIQEQAEGVRFILEHEGEPHTVQLQTYGRHNVANACASLAAAHNAGVALSDATKALSQFQGTKRRLERIGTAHGVEVIDDFAHNPDKIAATLAALHGFAGRLLIFFQPHGYGPLQKMHKGFVACFAQHMQPHDRLWVCDPVYQGGAVDKSMGSTSLTQPLADMGINAHYIANRADCGEALVDAAQSGDRILIMGARDDSLTQFAEKILALLQEKGV